MSSSGRGAKRFPSTHWSLVDRAGGSDSPARREALDRLLRIYMPALKVHLVRRKGLRPDAADDFLQDLVATKILQNDMLTSAAPNKGRFRSLLLTTLDRMIIDHYRRRDREQPLLSDAVPADDDGGHDPFELSWAELALGRALQLTKQDCDRKGQHAIWFVFVQRWLRPLFDGTPPLDYEQIARTEFFDSPSAARNGLQTAKRKFQKFLRQVVSEYTTSQAELSEEIQLLKSMLPTLALTSNRVRAIVGDRSDFDECAG